MTAFASGWLAYQSICWRQLRKDSRKPKVQPKRLTQSDLRHERKLHLSGSRLFGIACGLFYLAAIGRPPDAISWR
jgi:hypothetical protein